MKDFFSPEPVVLAHRGDSARYPENTMPAFESADTMGVDVIETDVHLTADREIVIWHDETLERMTGDDRAIPSLLWDDIKTVNAGYHFTPDSGLTYPYRERPVNPVLLKDVLIRFPNMRFNVDLKDNNPELAKTYAGLIMELQCEQRVITASFHGKILKLYRKFVPSALTSCTSDEVIRLILLYRSGLLTLPFPYKKAVLQVPELSGKIKVLSPGFIKFLHRRGFKVQVWTVNEESEMHRFLEMGVDGIFTDKPALLQQCLENRENSSQ